MQRPMFGLVHDLTHVCAHDCITEMVLSRHKPHNQPDIYAQYQSIRKHVEQLTTQQIQEIIADNELLMGTEQYPNLLQTDAGEIIKFFYQKNRLSTSTIFPKAKVFADNGVLLRKLQVIAPLTKRVAYCSPRKMYLVVYDRIPGKDLRMWDAEENGVALQGLEKYLAELHRKGVMFRGIHLGNVLMDDTGEYALVDISGLSFQSKPLSLWRRKRNLINLLGVEDDQKILLSYGLSRFVAGYCAAAGLDKSDIAYLNKKLSRRLGHEIDALSPLGLQ